MNPTLSAWTMQGTKVQVGDVLRTDQGEPWVFIRTAPMDRVLMARRSDGRHREFAPSAFRLFLAV